MRILTEPKNALVKQYQKLFSFDHVKLTFEPDAVEAIAIKAMERKPAQEDSAPFWRT